MSLGSTKYRQCSGVFSVLHPPLLHPFPGGQNEQTPAVKSQTAQLSAELHGISKQKELWIKRQKIR